MTRELKREASEVSEGKLLLETLSGFFIIVSARDEILFVSENVEKHMGLRQVSRRGGRGREVG